MKISKKILLNNAMISFVLFLSVIVTMVNFSAVQGRTTIDASDFIYSTFLGGSNKDLIRDGVIDGNNNMIITGQTLSPDFPVRNPAYSTYSGGDNDAHTIGGDGIVSKFDASGDLLWSTFLGGSNRDSGMGVRVDVGGTIYVVGVTNSPDFPVTEDAMYLEYLGGAYDLFITKFAPNGSVVYSSFLGTNGDDYTEDMDMDSAGNVVIVGGTTSSSLPVTNDAFQSTRKGSYDGFLFTLAPNCTTILYASYFGGTGSDVLGDVSVSADGEILAGGVTSSSEGFPLTTNAFQTELDTEFRDFFITKFNSSGGLLFSSFVGGNHMDDSFGVALDADGSMLVSGRTWSTDFPTKNAFQRTLSEGPDGFVSKFAANGALSFSSLVGGAGWDTILHIAADTSNLIVAVGFGGLDGFPIKNAFQEEHSGASDLVVMILSPRGVPIVCSYLGGSAMDHPRNIALSSSNEALIVGQTNSSDFYSVTNASYQSTLTGDHDGFIFRFDYGNYLEVNEIETNPSRSTQGTSVLIGCLAIAIFLKMRRKQTSK